MPVRWSECSEKKYCRLQDAALPSLSLSLSLSRSLAHSLSHSHSPTHSLPLTHSHSLSLTHLYMHIHTHTHTNSPTITPPSLSYFLFPSCFSMLSLSLEKLVTCGVIRSYNCFVCFLFCWLVSLLHHSLPAQGRRAFWSEGRISSCLWRIAIMSTSLSRDTDWNMPLETTWSTCPLRVGSRYFVWSCQLRQLGWGQRRKITMYTLLSWSYIALWMYNVMLSDPKLCL